MQVAEQHDLSIATHDPVPTVWVPTIDGKSYSIVGTSPIDSPGRSSREGPDLGRVLTHRLGISPPRQSVEARAA